MKQGIAARIVLAIVFAGLVFSPLIHQALRGAS